MSDHKKTKAELIEELTELRQEVARLKAVEADCAELNAQANGQELMSEESTSRRNDRTPCLFRMLESKP